jgi:hypothetical protein
MTAAGLIAVAAVLLPLVLLLSFTGCGLDVKGEALPPDQPPPPPHPRHHHPRPSSRRAWTFR